MITKTQSIFVPGRVISNNVMVAFGVQHYLKRKYQGRVGFVTLKLDMSKAYDQVKWPLLLAIFIKLAFNESTVSHMLSTTF